MQIARAFFSFIVSSWLVHPWTRHLGPGMRPPAWINLLFMGFLRKPGVLVSRRSWIPQVGPDVRPSAWTNSSPPGIRASGDTRTSVFVVLFMGFLRKPGVLVARPSWTLQAGPVVRPAASINSSPPGPSAFDILSPPTLEHPCSSSCPPRHFWPWRALCSGAQEVRELREHPCSSSCLWASFGSPVSSIVHPGLSRPDQWCGLRPR